MYIYIYIYDRYAMHYINPKPTEQLNKLNNMDHILTILARYINRSLFELANCIFALCDGNREHVPFRLVVQLFRRVAG